MKNKIDNDTKAKNDTETDDLKRKITELTTDLQRTRADFENYRKHTDHDLNQANSNGQISMVSKLLPVIDIIDSAVQALPDDLSDNDWAKGILAMKKKLDKTMISMKIEKIAPKSGDEFNHELHNAIQFDEAEGDKDVIASVLRPGYRYNEKVIRPALVSVTKK